jgi:myxalamid-type polyketide synthase MxaE and MxaD
VGILDEVQDTVKEIDRDMPKLRGVFHLAGINKDASFLNLDETDLHEVLQPKVVGTWHLHICTLGHKLDHFVTASSIASILGTTGQSSYVAANSFLDQFSHYRIQQGLPSLTVNLGAIAGKGMATAKKNLASVLDSMGLKTMEPVGYAHLIGRALDHSIAQITIADFDARKWKSTFKRSSGTPFFQYISSPLPTEPTNSSDTTLERLAKLQSKGEQISLIEEQVKRSIAGLLKFSIKKISAQSQFKELGVDSLITVQLRSKLEESFGISLNVTSFFAHPTVSKFSEFIYQELNPPVPTGEGTPVVSHPAHTANASDLSDLSLEELSDLLNQELIQS